MKNNCLNFSSHELGYGTQFLIQKIAIGVQRGNTASVMATVPSSQDWAEFAFLPTASKLCMEISDLLQLAELSQLQLSYIEMDIATHY